MLIWFDTTHSCAALNSTFVESPAYKRLPPPTTFYGEDNNSSTQEIRTITHLSILTFQTNKRKSDPQQQHLSIHYYSGVLAPKTGSFLSVPLPNRPTNTACTANNTRTWRILFYCLYMWYIHTYIYECVCECWPLSVSYLVHVSGTHTHTVIHSSDTTPYTMSHSSCQL